MARDYALDTNAAKEAGQHSRRITESGLFEGKFKFAWADTNDNGTESVNLFFVSNGGQECGPIALYTHNGKGDALPSFNMLNALMTCMKVRALQAEKGPVTLYDFDAKSDVTKTKDIYPALADKPIGIVIQMEEYTGRNGIKHRPQIAGAYDPATRLTAKEILEKAPEPKLLAGVQKWLEQNPVKHERKRAAPAGTPPISNGTTGGNFEDDEIPFN